VVIIPEGYFLKKLGFLLGSKVKVKVKVKVKLSTCFFELSTKPGRRIGGVEV